MKHKNKKMGGAHPQRTINKTKNKMRKELKFILGVIILFIAWGLIGNDEYEFEKRHETVITKNK